MISLTCESKKLKQNKTNKNKLVDTENRAVVSRGEGYGDGTNGWMQSKGTHSTHSYKISHGDVLYSRVTTVNNTVCIAESCSESRS